MTENNQKQMTPNVQINAQYIKDFSFEAPNPALSFAEFASEIFPPPYLASLSLHSWKGQLQKWILGGITQKKLQNWKFKS